MCNVNKYFEYSGLFMNLGAFYYYKQMKNKKWEVGDIRTCGFGIHSVLFHFLLLLM